jgi:hypothetical protein
MIIKFFLKTFNKILLRNQREKNIFFILIKLINELKPKNRISILDYGSGYDPLLIKLIVNNLCKSRSIKAECFDFYTVNQIQKLNIHLQLNKIMIKQTFLRVKSYKITSNMTNIYFFRKITLNRAQK